MTTRQTILAVAAPFAVLLAFILFWQPKDIAAAINQGLPRKIIVDSAPVSAAAPMPTLDNTAADTATTRTAGSGAIAFTVTHATSAFEIMEVRLHLSASSSTGTFTVTLDSGTAAAYDTLFHSTALSSTTDIIVQPGRPYLFEAGDEIDFALEDITATHGMEVLWRLVD